MKQQYWGIDLGGTKIEGAVLDEKKEQLVRLRIPAEASGGYRHILLRVKKLVQMMADELRSPLPEHIGIGTPGRIDGKTGLLKNSNTVCLNGEPLHADLQELLGAEAVIENDANCFAVAESLFGAGKVIMGRPDRVSFGIILGTGVGGGIVCGDKVIHGAHGIAGEWGHNELDPEGEQCYCGRKGCVETVLSGPALERFYTVQSEGMWKPLKEIAASAETDDAAKATLMRLLFGFGKAVAQVINILDPDIIIIGGGVGNIDALYSPAARNQIEKHLFNRSLDIPIVRPVLGDSAGVLGAALLSIA